MRIRTRYKLFKIIILVAALIFLATLYDMFLNTSVWKPYMFIGYGVLAVLALALYLGYKPDLLQAPVEPEPQAQVEAEPEPQPAPPMVEMPPPVAAEAPMDVEEVPRSRITLTSANFQGPYQFQCPYCEHIFGLEETQERTADFRIHCPYCAKSIRVPKRPLLTRQALIDLREASPDERTVQACAECGEVLRITAPHSRIERLLKIESCPRCRGTRIIPAATGTPV